MRFSDHIHIRALGYAGSLASGLQEKTGLVVCRSSSSHEGRKQEVAMHKLLQSPFTLSVFEIDEETGYLDYGPDTGGLVCRNQEVASVQYKLRDKEDDVGRVSWQATQAQHGLAHVQAALNKARL